MKEEERNEREALQYAEDLKHVEARDDKGGRDAGKILKEVTALAVLDAERIRSLVVLAILVLLFSSVAYVAITSMRRENAQTEEALGRPDIVDVQYIPAAFGQQQETILRFKDGSSAILNGHHNATIMVEDTP